MRNRMIFAALALAALVVPARTRAASDLPWSISALGGYARYSDRWFFPTDSLADAPVFGARLGRHFGNIWTLEAAGSYGKTHGVQRNGSDGEDVTVMNGSLSLMAQLTPPNQFGSLYLLGGMGYTSYNADVTDNEYHYGVLEGALGWTKSMNDHWSLRLEARNLLNLPEKNYGTANKADQQFWGGLSYDFGGKPKDSDG
ncbi:MAG: porin family protein, partial [Candidatus Eisenbacteria bacterium]|nr:porin family protein [Candidatus Eisenbacteria bacterium]